MDLPTATVISVDGRNVMLRVDSPIACARCAAGKGCGAGLLAGRQGPRELRLPLPSGLQLQADDRVQLNLVPARLLQATVYAYGLPLAALTLAPLFAHYAWGPLGDAQLVAVAAVAVAAAVPLGRRLLARNRCLERLVPDIVGRAPATSQ